MRNSVFVRGHNLEVFAVLPKDRYRYSVLVPVFGQNLEVPRILFLP